MAHENFLSVFDKKLDVIFFGGYTVLINRIINQLYVFFMEKKDFVKSFFKFEITQTTKVLMYKIRMGDGKRWNVSEDKERGRVVLMEIGRPMNVTLVMIGDQRMQIFTACSRFEYLIQDKENGDGAEVSFCGPVNALLTQALMPRMTYVPGTLQGMSEDMPDYAPIAEFMRIRKERRAADPNPQDAYGWRVNMKFQNELAPYFPPFDRARRENPKKQRRRERSGKFPR